MRTPRSALLSLCAAVGGLLSLLSCPSVVLAQAAGSAPAPAPASQVPSSAQVQGAPASSAPSGAGAENGGATVELSPFEVSSTEAKGYTALNSNSITQFKTELSKLPVSADIFDEKFMNDVGATSVEEMIESYSAGAGLSNANPGSSASNSQTLDRNGNSFLSFRGVTAPTMLRDGLLPLNTFFNSGSTSTNFTSSFDVESVAVIYGPQALLYGVGGAGGVINLVSKQARLGQPAFGSLEFSVDQYGHKLGLLDYGVGTDKVAVRVAVTQQQIGARRIDVGGPLQGEYVQVAFRLPIGEYTDLRFMGEQTNYDKQNSSTGVTVTGLSTANDARNGQYLHYLLYSGQLGAAANGAASGGGPIPYINWNNVDSLGTEWAGEYAIDTFETVTADTKWNSWLSTEATAGYRAEVDEAAGSGPGLAAPNVAANTTGVWALDTSNPGMLYEPLREKVARLSAVAINDLFGGRAHSQTVLGADYTRADGDVITYQYEKADTNWNPIVSTSTTNNGLTAFPTTYWPLTANPIRQAYFPALQKRVTVNGQNYVLMIPNDTITSLVGPGNPLGLSGHGSGDHRIGKAINSGVYLANDTDWLHGKLSTLVGIREGRTDELNQLETGFTTSGDLAAAAHTTSFNVGANYGLTNWIRPYIEASSSYDAPAVLSATPTGQAPGVAHAVGWEGGFKIAPESGVVSGTVAFFQTNSDNEQYSFTSTLTNDINPAGLNGRYGAVSNFVPVNRQTKGTNITVTASPTSSWTMRLSAAYAAGTISSNVTYPQYYNDQFNENSTGQVTYADGSLVYVSGTATKATGATSGAAGAVPLTVTMMNTSGSAYYANPAAVTAAINSSSGAATILRGTDATIAAQELVHGTILTGKTGLPISDLQIAPLASSPPPGQIVLAEPGDSTSQTPRLAFNYTSTYTFDGGPLKGLTLGGTVSDYWKYADYYYYPSGVSQPNASRILFYQPSDFMFSAILGYAHKLGRYTVSTRLNITNMFNTYHVFVLPNAVTGYVTGPDQVTFDQQPREYVWSTTIAF
jgi:outer membrane receptor protein involved in Fe transport